MDKTFEVNNIYLSFRGEVDLPVHAPFLPNTRLSICPSLGTNRKEIPRKGERENDS